MDTTAADDPGVTGFAFGFFRPAKLKAKVDYAFAYTLFLPNKPSKNVHSFHLSGEVVEQNCPIAGAWCVGLPGSERKRAFFIGVKRAWSVKGTTCWAWRRGHDPKLCAAPPPPPPPPVAPPPVAPPPPSPGPPPPPPPDSREFHIEDSFLGGTWARTDPDNGTWYSQGNRPPNGAYWYPNGLGIAVDCARTAAGYVVKWVDGHTENWDTWFHVTDGKWYPSAATREVLTNGLQGLRAC